MEASPEDLKRKDFYKLLTGTIVPRPIAWVSTINQAGQPNLAPFSFFNAVCSKPPTVLFCPSIRSTDGNQKDTLYNVETSKEFVINIVTEELAEAMNRTATELPPEINEFEFANLSTSPSVVVKPPRLAESPINIECKMTQVIKIGDGSKGSGNIVIGEVVHLHVDDSVLKANYHIDMQALKPIGRLAGPNYSLLRETLEIYRLPSQVKPD